MIGDIMQVVRIVNEYDANGVSDNNALHCDDESLTRQEFKEESDINTIISAFGIGENPIEAQKWVTNVDITEETTDFQSAMNQLVAAAAQFNSLPARVRSQFDNDPAAFVDFVSNPDNGDEMVRLGLAEIRREPIPSDTDRIIAAVKEGHTAVAKPPAQSSS